VEIRVNMTQEQEKRRFELPFAISAVEKTYSDNKEALLSPIAHKIFGFPWTQAVEVGTQWVTVTKQDWVDWEVLEEPLKGLIAEHFSGAMDLAAGKPLEENPEPQKPEIATEFTSPEGKAIVELFESEVNPSLASHGGFVTLLSVEEDTAFIAMGGGCQGCAMSYMTLKEGIETAIFQKVPAIKKVVDKTDHGQGENPFYTSESQ